MAIDPISIGMTLLGGLLGGQSSSTNQSTSREPWAPAQPWLRNNIVQGQKLQDYYEKNPFNKQQQTGYNNLFNDTDYFRSSVAPGMMDFANSMMGSNYQRSKGTVGSAGYSDVPMPLAALPPQSGPFTLPTGSKNFGSVDFAAINPYTNGGVTPAPVVPATVTNTNSQPEGPGGNHDPAPSTPDWATAYSIAQMIGIPALTSHVTDGILGSSNSAARAADAMPSTTTGLAQGYDGKGSQGNTGNNGGGVGGGGLGGAGDGGDPALNAKGGFITAEKLKGPNPPGPDDGYSGLDIGEYVIKKSAVDKYGRGLLDSINEGKLPAKALRGLLM